MPFNKITSDSNLIIRSFSKLRQKKYRSSEKKFIIEGLRAVEEVIKAKMDAVFVMTESFLMANPSFSDKISSAVCYVVTEKIFSSLTETQTPQGILAVADIPALPVFPSKPYYIYLDRVCDPGNLGTIIRTAHAFGIGGIMLSPGSCDVYSGKVIRSAMGSYLYTDIYTDYSYDELFNLKNEGYSIYSTALLPDSKSLFECDLGEKTIFVIGNEANGVSSDILDRSDKTIIIPMPGGAESLNAAVAAALVMSEAVRKAR